MADLTTARRNNLKSSTFGLPAQRKYPMPDKAHAANAKARASQQANAGHITSAQKAQIDSKANKILGYGTVNHKPGCGGNHLGDCPKGM